MQQPQLTRRYSRLPDEVLTSLNIFGIILLRATQINPLSSLSFTYMLTVGKDGYLNRKLPFIELPSVFKQSSCRKAWCTEADNTSFILSGERSNRVHRERRKEQVHRGTAQGEDLNCPIDR